jgi:hypothetical protein
MQSMGLKKTDTAHFLFFLTMIQFWWIAVWGLAYILIENIAGSSKHIEVMIYFIMMISTAVVLRANPEIVEFF